MQRRWILTCCSGPFKCPAEKVLRELISVIQLAGCQHFGFKEYLDPHGNRLFAGHSNGSVSFQLAQIRVGPGKVPVSLVIYIDTTYIKKGIPICPIYCKCTHYRIQHRIQHWIHYRILFWFVLVIDWFFLVIFFPCFLP
jgi:hypothetical protein